MKGINETDKGRAKDALMGLIGDNVKEYHPDALYNRLTDQYQRHGEGWASWPLFVDLMRDCGCVFESPDKVLLPSRPAL